MLDFLYGFSVGFSFYLFWFGFGMGFLTSMGCGGDSWVVLSWGFFYLSSSSLLSCYDCCEREGTRMRWRVKLERKRESDVEREKTIKY